MLSVGNGRTAPPRSATWQAPFLTMLPAIERRARRSLVHIPRRDREEALQSIVASAAVAYARLVQLDKPGLGYPGPLADYGFKQYCAGRVVGSRMNSRDVGSKCCRRAGVMERLDDWKEVLAETRRATPAEIAAMRIDFGDWLQTLAPRDRRLANALASGEQTTGVAKMFRLSAGRVSQLRRKLYVSWQRFVGEPVAAAV